MIMGFFDKFFSGKNNHVTGGSAPIDAPDANVFQDSDLSQDPSFYEDVDSWGGVRIAKVNRS